MIGKLQLSALIVLISLQTVLAQTIPGICNWDRCKKAAVVLTFDDWSPGIFPVASPALKSKSLTGTFFMVTRNIASWNRDWPDVRTLLGDGNEIANHTFSHPTLTIPNSQYKANPSDPNITNYPDVAAQLKGEIRDPKATLEQNLTNTKILTFAYPQGTYSQQVLDSVKKNGHICARGVTPPSGIYYNYNFASTNNDYYDIKTYPMSSSVTLNTFTGQVNNVINGGGLLTFLYHSLDNGSIFNDSWYSQVQQSALLNQLDTLVRKQKKIWVTTLVQAVKYHKQRNSATLTEVNSPSAGQWILNLTDTLSNNSIYNQPLSIQLKMNGVNYGAVTQNNIALKIDSIYNDTIQFKAVPDAGSIRLSVVTEVENNTITSKDFMVSPVPSNGILNIQSAKVLDQAEVSLTDMTGKVVYNQNSIGRNGTQLDFSSFEKGVYYLRIIHKDGVFSQKVIFN